MNDNMEDRLRRAFETEAEHLNAPPGSLETTIRRGQRRRATTMIGGAALAFVLIGGAAVGFQVAQSDPDPEPDPDRIAAAETITSDETTEDIADTSTAQIPITETFVWEQVELPVPPETDVFDIRVASVNGTLLAVGQSFSPEDDGPGLRVWTSVDGASWEATADSLALGETLENVFFSDDAVMLVGREYATAPEGEVRQESLTFLTSEDGLSWQAGTADFQLEANEFAWIPSGAIGNGVFLVAASANTEPPQPPVVLEETGITIQENHMLGTATVFDTATGDIIAEIPIDTLFGYGTPGPVIYDAAGEQVVVIPGEEMENAYQAAQGDATSSFEFPDEIVVEYANIRLTLRQQDYTFTAEDLTSGEIIASGNQDELYRPPRLVIEDPDTGEVLVDMDWDAFYEAQDRSYRLNEGKFEYRARTLIFRSTDGTTWEQVDSPGTQGDVVGLEFGPAGFLLTTLSEPSGPAFWWSPDGLTWSPAPTDFSLNLGSEMAADDRYYYTANGLAGSFGVVRSADLRDWETVFELSRDTWVSNIATGDLGVVALGQTDNYVDPDITITNDGKTFFLSPEEGVVTVTDDPTGEVLANIVFDPYVEEEPEGIVALEDDSGFEILGDDGEVIMTVTNEDMVEAVSGRSFTEEYRPEQIVLYSPNGGDWARVSTGDLDIGYASGLAVGTESVVISGEPRFPYDEEIVISEDGSETSTVVTAIASGELSAPRVWVGRPS